MGELDCRDLREFPGSSQVIYLKANFSEFRVHHRVMDGWIKDIPTEDDADLEANLANLEVDPPA